MTFADDLRALLDELAPGVFGRQFDRPDGSLWIPIIVAENPGHGAVSAFLDQLPRDRTVVVPTVVSMVLEGALARRGFEEAELPDPEDTQTLSVMIRRACSADGADRA